MNFFLILFRTSLRECMSSVRTWILLLLLPLMTFGAARLLPAEEVSTPVQVGVVLPETGGVGFWQRLEPRGGLVVTFRRASRDQAERQIASGQWDCALVLPEDFDTRLARRDVEGLFTLLIGPGSAVYPMVRETAAACVAELISPGIAEDYLLDSGILDGVGVEAVRPRLNQVLLDRDRVLVWLETADGRSLDPLTLADRGMSNLLSGLTAVLLLIWVLFTAMDLGRWLNSPFARRLAPLWGTFPLLLPRMAAALLPALCSGALALTAVGTKTACVLALIPYLLFWGAAALALAQWRPGWSALPALMPFVPTLGLLLSPVLLDLSPIFPALGGIIRWTPVTLYLRACGGSWGDGLLLAAGGAAILALQYLTDREKGSPREPGGVPARGMPHS